TRPAAIPARSDSVLVTTTTYSTAGNVDTMTDPLGIVTSRTWDRLDRLTVLVENDQGSSGSSSSGSSSFDTDIRTTRYGYTDDSWLKWIKCDNAATGSQVTQWIYGVTPALGSELYSNRLVYRKKYPDSTGDSDSETYKYNRQQEGTGLTDQAGTVHAYA